MHTSCVSSSWRVGVYTADSHRSDTISDKHKCVLGLTQSQMSVCSSHLISNFHQMILSIRNVACSAAWLPPVALLSQSAIDPSRASSDCAGGGWRGNSYSDCLRRPEGERIGRQLAQKNKSGGGGGSETEARGWENETQKGGNEGGQGGRGGGVAARGRVIKSESTCAILPAPRRMDNR